MSSFGKRLITTIVAIPALFCVIFFLPQLNHLAFAIVAVLAAVIGTHEMWGMAFPLNADGKRAQPLIPFWLPAIIPAMQWFELTYFPYKRIVDITLIGLFIIAFIVEVFRGASDHYAGTFDRVSRTTLLIIYPSYLISFVIRLFAVEFASLYLLLMLLIVCGNDIFAYLFGMAFGKNNKGVFKVSPNKSIAGFVGGTLSSIILSITMVRFVPELYAQVTLFQAGILGLIISITANAGDLIESAFKRSCGVKDSGTIIPGRGGLLDSIDSIIVSAPAFLLLLTEWII